MVVGETAPPAVSSGGCFIFFCGSQWGFIFPSAPPPLRQQHANAKAKDKRERERSDDEDSAIQPSASGWSCVSLQVEIYPVYFYSSSPLRPLGL